MSLIKARNLSVKIGQKQILKRINLDVEEGTVTAFIGPSGSGKTTLLRTLNLLQEPSEGTIEVNGTKIEAGKIDKRQVEELRQNSAMVFQQFNLFKNMTALENVAAPLILNGQLPKKEARQLAREVLAEVGLEQVADQYPITLSGGQQQRVSIARAIAVKPKVILFDEPTSALDPELVGDVLQTIANLAKEHITMILVTHEMDFARQIADQAFFIEDGEIFDQGPASELLSGRGAGRISSFVNSLEKVAVEK
ncbi:amino acid ABC transporter ATP-binding protein [Limosilactobacillus fermentum]|uniref:Amino acid ABC transporter ATP-binding protein n=1 Tax=Limosilactobacillus fermentum 3872 TaxID=1381124 RepID=A0A806TVI8_LIMFE|nr:amino acid ABC transporter ATP-binding protein [Limosilactobacillus fermentum]EQC58174.1 ABC transporter ATP-binding protein [Limosilactobacillus fermentum MTCC 8711]AKM51150.1 amino acid ABC transporter ATP-binding protein [Limosilactobacillus fermentum 3872]ARB00602.1 amino acid ABC transporter ATP-binding protein [Limosilactobacillus fermentum]KAB1963038.1 amino acid ABC transporter ATP-binding protein [Limosilactobacillus fermentum]MCH5386591.1 amino acid ABC transporter ATP-binding pro